MAAKRVHLISGGESSFIGEHKQVPAGTTFKSLAILNHWNQKLWYTPIPKSICFHANYQEFFRFVKDKSPALLNAGDYVKDNGVILSGQ